MVYLLLAGSVKVTGATRAGTDALLAIRAGGDAVGELAALDEKPRLATVTTAGRVQLLIIKQADFLDALQRDHKLALAVARGVSDKLRTSTSSLIDFTESQVITRVARAMFKLAKCYGKKSDAGRTFVCPLTQGELATLAGVSEETVQRVLRQLRADDIITTRYRQIMVLDMGALADLAHSG